MKREEYIKELRQRLSGLSESEIADAVAYCEEYFDEAEDEEKAMEDLGSPSKFAAQLKAEAVCKTSKSPDQKPHSLWKSFFMIMAGIFALPIALPLLLTIVILIFVFALLLFVLILCGFVLIACLFYVSAAAFVASFTVAQGTGDMLMHLGASCMSLGGGILAVVAVITLVKVVIPSFIYHLSNFYERHKGGRKDEI